MLIAESGFGPKSVMWAGKSGDECRAAFGKEENPVYLSSRFLRLEPNGWLE